MSHMELTGELSESVTQVKTVTGGHRYTVDTFAAINKDTKKSLGSATFTVGEHKWQIVCYPGGETEEVQDYVSLFLGYRGPEQECQANWRLTLVNHLDPTKRKTRAWLKSDKFNRFLTGRRWGWQRFIKREELLDPENGFIKDDTVVFEASLDVFTKQKTKLKTKLDLGVPNLYPIPPSTMSDDLSMLLYKANPWMSEDRSIQPSSLTCKWPHVTNMREFSPFLLSNFDNDGNDDNGDSLTLAEDVNISTRNTRSRFRASTMGLDRDSEEVCGGVSLLDDVKEGSLEKDVTQLDLGDVENGDECEDKLYDIEFSFETERRTIKAHSPILVARSPVLAKMFRNTFSESRELKKGWNESVLTIPIVDVPFRVFVEVIRFLYTDGVNWEVLKSASETSIRKRSPISKLEVPTGSTPSLKRKKRSSSTLQQLHQHPEETLDFETGTEPDLAPYSSPTRSDERNLVLQEYSLKYESLPNEHDDTSAHILELFAAADRYELNRLRLICEHEMYACVRDALNAVQNYELSKSNRGLPLLNIRGFPSAFVFARNDQREQLDRSSRISTDKRRDVVIKGMFEILDLADRHSLKQLERLWSTLFFSEAVASQTRNAILSSSVVAEQHPTVFSKLLQFELSKKDYKNQLKLHGQKPTNEMKPVMDYDNEIGQQYGYYEQPLEVNQMTSAELMYELSNRGYSVQGTKELLTRRLALARQQQEQKFEDLDNHQ